MAAPVRLLVILLALSALPQASGQDDGTAPVGEPAGAGASSPNGTTSPPAGPYMPTLYAGTHVAFGVTGWGLANYTVDGVLVFRRITFDPPLQPEALRVEGIGIKVSGRGGFAQVTDLATGPLHAGGDGNVSLGLAPGLAAADPATAQDIAEGRHAILGPAGLVGFVSGPGMASLANDTVLVAGTADVLVYVPPPPTAALTPEITQAVEEGHIGAQVVVESTPKGVTATATPAASSTVNLTVTGTPDYVFATVEGHGAGTALLFTVEHGVLQGAPTVRFDGKTIHQARDLAAILDPQPDAPAQYLVVVGANATQVLVSVPHFSTHTIEIASAGPVEVVAPLLGSPAAFAVAGAAALAFVAATTLGQARRARQR